MELDKRNYARHSSFFSSLKNKLHGRPFRSVHSHLSEKEDQLLQRLESSLSVSLEGLHPSSEVELWSLQWLQQLMDAMLEASVFLPKVLPSDVQGRLTRRDEKLLSSFLDANAKYLDACNAVRDGMGKLEHLQMHIKSILHVLDTNKGSLSEPQLTRARKSFHECLSELRNEQSQDQISSTTSLLQTISDKLVVPKNSEASSSLQAFAMAEYMANIISVFTLGISLAAFLPRKRGNVVEISHVSRHYAWSFELLSLQEEVKENAGMKKHLQPGLLRELDVLHICLTRLSSVVDSTISARKLPLRGEQDEEFQQAVEDLRHLSHDLAQGLQRMDLTISELFRQLIISRNAVLDLLSLAMG